MNSNGPTERDGTNSALDITMQTPTIFKVLAGATLCVALLAIASRPYAATRTGSNAASALSGISYAVVNVDSGEIVSVPSWARDRPGWLRDAALDCATNTETCLAAAFLARYSDLSRQFQDQLGGRDRLISEMLDETPRNVPADTFPTVLLKTGIVADAGKIPSRSDATALIRRLRYQGSLAWSMSGAAFLRADFAFRFYGPIVPLHSTTKAAAPPDSVNRTVIERYKNGTRVLTARLVDYDNTAQVTFEHPFPAEKVLDDAGNLKEYRFIGPGFFVNNQIEVFSIAAGSSLADRIARLLPGDSATVTTLTREQYQLHLKCLARVGTLDNALKALK